MDSFRSFLGVRVPLFLLLATRCGGTAAPAGGPPGLDAGSDATSGSTGDAAVASTGDAGAGEAGGEDAASDAPSSGGEGGTATPIVAPADAWTWVDFPESKCASGSPTGIGVNPHAGATTLVIYLEGGGSCTDAESCWGPNPGANNLSGYDAATFSAATQLKYPLLVRSVSGNPLATANFAYVPYCTGDMHGGAKLAQLAGEAGTIPTYFWGARDLDLFVARLVPTFPGMTRVYLFGTSAGGFGTVLDFDRVSRAFGVRTDIIDDSGPPITAKGASDNLTIFDTWGYVAPAGCSGCSSLPAVYSFDRAAQPSSRYAFLSFAQDDVIAPRFGYTVAEYPAVVDAFSSSIANDPNAATYIVTNETDHVVESQSALLPQYLPWITQMVNDDPAWKDGTYANP